MTAVQLRTGREYGSGTLESDALVMEAEIGAAAAVLPATPRDITSIITTITTAAARAAILIVQPGLELPRLRDHCDDPAPALILVVQPGLESLLVPMSSDSMLQPTPADASAGATGRVPKAIMLCVIAPDYKEFSIVEHR